MHTVHLYIISQGLELHLRELGFPYIYVSVVCVVGNRKWDSFWFVRFTYNITLDSIPVAHEEEGVK